MNPRLISALVLSAMVISKVANASDQVSEAWGKTIQQAAFVKDGLERFLGSTQELLLASPAVSPLAPRVAGSAGAFLCCPPAPCLCTLS